jgi:Mannosylglycerate hydrolase MGH1-like glycoside hydrolase domain
MKAAWRLWGPYLSERAWGTVREDYSADGDAWRYLSHDQARSKAYRWSEDGLAGICDAEQRLCLAFAFWNGRDPILKERIFGLTGPEGNHGEDAKELWWYVDATPDARRLAWRYVYPQAAFPYDALVRENARRTRDDPEFELADTGVLDDGFWAIDVEYAKAAPDDICVRLVAHNRSAVAAALDVLPTMWFRNTWSWSADATKPSLHADAGAIVAEHPTLGRYVLAGDGAPELLFCDNETNAAFAKDGIGEHVVHGASTVNPAETGTKAAFRYRLEAAPGESAEIRLRLAPERRGLGNRWARTLAASRSDADALYAGFDAGGDNALVLRQALAGMLWSKQFFHYDVERWLDGDPGQPVPPTERRHGRNSGWTHLVNAEVISMPDKWEYPWYAAWDLAFHTLPLALVDPEFAKQQLLLLTGVEFMHPDGQLPAYEWNFSDANPPVHAWAALRVFELDGSRDFGFLERMLHKLLLNFTWWVNREDSEGRNVFGGGFLGLDNISPIDRSVLPPDERLEQSDATGWMARYCLDLLRIALVLGESNSAYEDLAVKFALHFAVIANAIEELWDEGDGFYYDRLRFSDGSSTLLRVHSAVGLIPLFAAMELSEDRLARFPALARALDGLEREKPQLARAIARDASGRRVLAVVPPERLERMLARVFDEDEFLSPYGLRSLSRYHLELPFELDVNGVRARVDYEPAESTTPLFGGNSNWRGPIWMPINYLAVEGLRAYHATTGEGIRVELPARSGTYVSVAEAADELERRLTSIFLAGPDGRRPVQGSYGKLQDDPAFRALVPFHEYFHAENGAGLGASHQTGWTGLVAMLLSGRRD